MTGVGALGPGPAARLRQAGLEPDAVVRLVDAALAEDLAGGADVTTAATITPGTQAKADVVARESGVAAGLPVSGRGGVLILPLLVLPLLAPAVIFGAGAVISALDGLANGALLLLSAFSLAAVLLAPFAAAASLRLHLAG